jgi:Patatin-like phospholipase
MRSTPLRLQIILVYMLVSGCASFGEFRHTQEPAKRDMNWNNAYLFSREEADYRAARNSRRLDSFQSERPYRSGGDLPQQCLALSGGGVRAATYSIGVMKALSEHGHLDTLDLVSAVSGGSYAMSWYFHYLSLEGDSKALFSDNQLTQVSDGGLPLHLWLLTKGIIALASPPLTLGVSIMGLVVPNVSDPPGSVNLSAAYRTLLLPQYTIYLKKPSPNKPLTNSRSERWKSIEEIGEYVRANHLPGLIFNMTIQDATSERLRSHGQIFELTPWRVGSEWDGYLTHSEIQNDYRMRGVTTWDLNKAMTVSGAATAKPIQGCTAYFLLDTCSWSKLWAYVRIYSGLTLGKTTWAFDQGQRNDRQYYFLSDGGHSENLGAYALIQRHCANIIIADGEEEPDGEYLFEGYTVLKSLVKNRLLAKLEVPVIDKYLDHQRACSEPRIDCDFPSTTWDEPSMDGTIFELPVQNEIGVISNPLMISYIKLSLDRKTMGSPSSQVLEPGQCARYSKDPSPQSYYTKSLIELAGKDAIFPMYKTEDQGLETDQKRALIDLGYAQMKDVLCRKDAAATVDIR